MNSTQLVYKLIYQKQINYVLRQINLIFRSVFPNIVKLPPSHKIIIKTDSGKLSIATNQTSYLTQLLFWNGYKSFEYSELFEDLSKEVNSFLDIGSNIGYYSLLAANANSNIKIYAFEPALGPKHYLNQNIKLNKFQNNITSVDLALSDFSGEIDFYEVENQKYTYLKYNLAGEGNAGTKTTSRNFKKNTVLAITLQDFVEQEKLGAVDLIKMDTEGTEVDILKSGKDFIKSCEPIVICETLFNTTENDLDAFFKELDYEFFNHTIKGLEKVSTIKRSKDNGVRNCFFVPKSKLHLISKYSF